MSQTTVLNAFLEDTVDWLSQELLLDVSDETKAGLVRAGKLQDDPTVAELNILIRMGNDEWRHRRAPKDHHALAHVGAFQELGATVAQFWLRRYVLDLKLTYIGEVDRIVAQASANLILARAEDALLRSAMPDLDDSFGERALLIDLEDSYLNETGGPGAFIHRGFIRFEVLTERIRD